MNNNNKILFQCNLNNTHKDLSEATKVIGKKFFLSLKIVWIITVIVSLGYYFISVMIIDGNLFLIEAIGFLFNEKRLILIYILFTLIIWSEVYIMSWILFKRIKSIREKSKDIGSKVCFFETFYKVPGIKVINKNCSQVEISYSDISKIYVTKNLYVLRTTSSMKSLTIIRKDSFEIGLEKDFIKFIESKTNNK